MKLECFSKSIVFGKRLLDYLLAESVDYYNHYSSHIERDYLLPIHEAPEEVEKLQLDEAEVKPYVVGLIKAFGRKAASSERSLCLTEIAY